MLVNDVTHRLDIPHEAGEWMQFRELGFEALDACREERRHKVLTDVRTMGAAFISEMEGARDDEEVKAADADPANSYDRAALLRASIIAWSYTVPPSAASIATLDEKTAAWAFRACVGFYHQTEEERFLASSPSTEPSTE